MLHRLTTWAAWHLAGGRRRHRHLARQMVFDRLHRRSPAEAFLDRTTSDAPGYWTTTTVTMDAQ